MRPLPRSSATRLVPRKVRIDPRPTTSESRRDSWDGASISKGIRPVRRQAPAPRQNRHSHRYPYTRQTQQRLPGVLRLPRPTSLLSNLLFSARARGRHRCRPNGSEPLLNNYQSFLVPFSSLLLLLKTEKTRFSIIKTFSRILTIKHATNPINIFLTTQLKSTKYVIAKRSTTKIE